MKTTYFEADDTLVLHRSDRPIVREVSQSGSVGNLLPTRLQITLDNSLNWRPHLWNSLPS